MPRHGESLRIPPTDAGRRLDPGREEVADYALNWAERNARPSGKTDTKVGVEEGGGDTDTSQRKEKEKA